MITCRDFEAHEISPAGFLTPAAYTSIQNVMDDVNSWLDRDDVDVINSETVVLPNIHRAGQLSGGRKDSTNHAGLPSRRPGSIRTAHG